MGKNEEWKKYQEKWSVSQRWEQKFENTSGEDKFTIQSYQLEWYEEQEWKIVRGE